eukprot:PhM_4_TR14869/c0_g1_i1/m.2010/K09598/SPPL3; signal peptide peptidase-like 3
MVFEEFLLCWIAFIVVLYSTQRSCHRLGLHDTPSGIISSNTDDLISNNSISDIFSSSAGAVLHLSFSRHALLIPIFLSATLLICYFFHSGAYYLMLCFCVCYGSIALYRSCLPYVPRRSYACIFSATIMISWILSNAWFLTDIIAVCLVVTVVDLVHVGSLRVMVALFLAIAAYDVFWVWLSPIFFSSSVMLDVAMRAPPSPIPIMPVSSVESGESGLNNNNSSWIVIPGLDLPIKFTIPVRGGGGNSSDDNNSISSVVLGLGDLVIPGIMLSYLQSVDIAMIYTIGRRRSTTPPSSPSSLIACSYCNSAVSRMTYRTLGLLGYLIGLHGAFFAMHTTHAAQPAMAYVVPAVMVFVFARGWTRYRRRHARDDYALEWEMLWYGTHTGPSQSRPVSQHSPQSSIMMTTSQSNGAQVFMSELACDRV